MKNDRMEAWSYQGSKVFPRWSGCPKEPTPLPFTIKSRKVRVIPGRIGIAFIGIFFITGLVSLRFVSGMAVAWTVFVWTILAGALVRNQQNVSGIKITSIQTTPTFAGENALLTIGLESPKRNRKGLILGFGTSESPATHFHMSKGQPIQVSLQCPTTKRGLLALGKLRISSLQPFGWTLSFGWFWPKGTLLVYPSPEKDAPNRPELENNAQSTASQSVKMVAPEADSDLLRNYREGDNAKHISWKASARHQTLLIRQSPPRNKGRTVISWDSVEDLPKEKAISRLTQWIIQANKESIHFSLELPGETLGPAQGPAHFHACLRALALLPE